MRKWFSRANAVWDTGLVLAVLLIASERNLQGYVDPGSGSLIWQLLVAGFVGALYYVRKLAKSFRRNDRSK